MFSEYRSYNDENKQDLCIYELVQFIRDSKDSSDTKTLANVFNWPENYRVKNLSLMKQAFCTMMSIIYYEDQNSFRFFFHT